MRQNSSITAYNYQKNENFRYAKHLLDKEYDNPQKLQPLLSYSASFIQLWILFLKSSIFSLMSSNHSLSFSWKVIDNRKLIFLCTSISIFKGTITLRHLLPHSFNISWCVQKSFTALDFLRILNWSFLLFFSNCEVFQPALSFLAPSLPQFTVNSSTVPLLTSVGTVPATSDTPRSSASWFTSCNCGSFNWSNFT